MGHHRYAALASTERVLENLGGKFDIVGDTDQIETISGRLH